MKAHIVCDSAYGNTKAIAEAITAGPKPLHAAAVSVADFDPQDLAADDLLIVGSPINGWRPTLKITELLTRLGTAGSPVSRQQRSTPASGSSSMATPQRR
ncbi:UNVERIFIED_ORG: flavorubredoxin [Arthrobacter sp. UYEF10]|uniref:flavodoxin family protein n=1 Tax=unclassified Arthrobacter TaxID=235627 RepID=UPI00339A2046